MKRVGKLNKYDIQIIVLVADTREHLQHTMNKFEGACDNVRQKMNVGKCKVLVVKKDQSGSYEKVRVSVGGNARGGRV